MEFAGRRMNTLSWTQAHLSTSTSRLEKGGLSSTGEQPTCAYVQITEKCEDTTFQPNC